MPFPVTNALPPIAVPAAARTPLASGDPAGNSGFSAMVTAAIANVESSDRAAKAAASDLLIGGKGEIHEVALVAQRAELTLELFQQVRNKLVQAYQEVMRMPM